jgi:competence protein ComEA
MKNALYVLLGVMAGFVLAGVLVYVSRAPAGEPIVLRPAPTSAPIAVDVVGAVPRPGLYTFLDSARVQDAIDAAGGLLAEADASALNLAALLEDGQQLVIPYKAGSEPTETVDLPSSETATPPPNSGEDLVNINTATLEELDKLPGIGTVTAQKIIDYRLLHGPFAKIEDITNVSGIGGIGSSSYNNIKDLITVGN